MEDNSRISDPHVCAVCHQRHTGCCQLAPGVEALLFGLTDAECRAIAAHTGKPLEEFTERDTASVAFLNALREIHPAFLQTLPGGQRIHLRIVDGDCCFLGPEGCELPEDVRPYYCRLYPFWINPDDDLMLLRSNTCLAQEGALSVYGVLERLEESEQRVRAIFADWLAAAREHGERHA